jgi:acetolactate synthase-1/2/3 large subunit
VALSSARRATIILGSTALGEDALRSAGQIAAATGAALFSQHSARHQRGAGRVPVKPIPSPIDVTIAALAPFDVAICIGAKPPVGFFAYPGKPSEMLPHECKVIELGNVLDDLPATIAALRDELGANGETPELASFNQKEIEDASGALTAEAVGRAVARRLPENAIICDESVTSGRNFAQLAYGLPPHDHLPLTGGSIGIGIPLSVGAAIACPDRKVILLQADGSGMYTVQGLWTQARENLDVVTIIYSNRAYAILQGEMRNVGVKEFGRNARSMLDLDDPQLDWCRIAGGMGVEAGRATTVEEFTGLLDAALARRGPFLIEAMI